MVRPVAGHECIPHLGHHCNAAVQKEALELPRGARMISDRLTGFKRRYPDVWPTNYKVGMWLALLHRLTALYLIGYVMFHLVEMAISLFGPGAFDRFFGFGYTWWMQVMDLTLITAVMYHGMNGLRIVLMDLGIGVRRHKLLAVVTMMAALPVYGYLVHDIVRFMLRWKTL